MEIECVATDEEALWVVFLSRAIKKNVGNQKSTCPPIPMQIFDPLDLEIPAELHPQGHQGEARLAGAAAEIASPARDIIGRVENILGAGGDADDAGNDDAPDGVLG